MDLCLPADVLLSPLYLTQLCFRLCFIVPFRLALHAENMAFYRNLASSSIQPKVSDLLRETWMKDILAWWEKLHEGYSSLSWSFCFRKTILYLPIVPWYSHLGSSSLNKSELFCSTHLQYFISVLTDTRFYWNIFLIYYAPPGKIEIVRMLFLNH